MDTESWIKGFPASIVVCDTNGMILEMNDRACENFVKDGGEKLVGKNLFDCHPEHARKKLKVMIDAQLSNCYTVEKNGVKKLVYQTPWYSDGVFKGFVEMIIDIPTEIPNYRR